MFSSLFKDLKYKIYFYRYTQLQILLHGTLWNFQFVCQ